MEFLLVVLGAAISLVGSGWISRRSDVRDRRAHIYYELMPELMNYTGRRGFAGDTMAQLAPYEFRELVEPVLRSSVAIGGLDARKARNVYEHLISWSELTDGAITAEDPDTGDLLVRFEEPGTEAEQGDAHFAFLNALKLYDNWLAARLAKRLPFV